MRYVLAMLAAFATAYAAAQPLDPLRIGGAPSAQMRLEQIEADLRTAFERAVDRYDAEISAAPHRAGTRIARCEFMESFQSAYEYVSWIDEVYDRSTACVNDLDAELGEHPELALWKLERLYDAGERLETGERLAAVIDGQLWTAGQRARLYTALAHAMDQADGEARGRAPRTIDYARRALALDVRADVRLELAAAQHTLGDDAAAIETLAAPFEGHDPEDNWYRIRKLHLLGELGQREAALAVHAELASHDSYYDRSDAAAVLLELGAIDAARRELSGERASGLFESTLALRRFVLELDHGSADDALAAYDALRDIGWSNDPVGINRVALLLAHPTLPWRARDALGLLGGVAMALALVAAWLVPLWLVHYFGLISRVAGHAPARSPDGLRLRDAMWGLGALSLSSALAFYMVGPIDLLGDGNWLATWVATDTAQSADMLVAESLVLAVVLVGVVYRLRRHFARSWSTDWSLAKSIGIGAALGLGFRLPMLAMLLGGFDIGTTARLNDPMWQLLSDIAERTGVAAAIWIVAIAAPVGEEVVFRGLLLRGALRHVPFWAANGVQAALFAAVHFNLPAAPVLFGFALAAGGLARWSGGLLAPIAMHATFNLAIAAVVFSGGS